jgi:hypothetical protein
MTEFEMAYLAQEMAISRTAQVSLIISIMSAFMVVGYTAAHRLTITLNVLIVVLYSLLLFPRISLIITTSAGIVGLLKVMAERATKGTEFQWNPVIVYSSDSFLADNYLELNAIIWCSLFLATIAFYFLARQLNLKREREEAAKLASVANAAIAKPPSSETQSPQP